jgi:hypothetical protein
MVLAKRISMGVLTIDWYIFSRMRKCEMTEEELKVVLENHRNWFLGLGGQRAYLSGANLSGADLSEANLSEAYLRGADLNEAYLRGANLSEANLSEANLGRANLSGAYLRRANLSGANLSGANLSGAYLRRANLSGANLSGANLRGADLSGADLRGADLSGVTPPDFQICPEEGDFIGWKKLQGNRIAKLLVPAEAKRTSTLVGRKCRAEFVKVLELSESTYDTHSGRTLYPQGAMVYPDKYDDDIRIECTNGIHFFITKREVEEY